MTVSVTIYCNQNFYGPRCDIECLDGGMSGHYSCSSNGTKVCHRNYYGQDCEKYCMPSDNSRCSADGTKVCRTNYYGKNCEEYCKATNNDAAGYHCAENGTKIFLKNWCTVNCNVSCGIQLSAQGITAGTNDIVQSKTGLLFTCQHLSRILVQVQNTFKFFSYQEFLVYLSGDIDTVHRLYINCLLDNSIQSCWGNAGSGQMSFQYHYLYEVDPWPLLNCK